MKKGVLRLDKSIISLTVINNSTIEVLGVNEESFEMLDRYTEENIDILILHKICINIRQ
ncbi:hypothetical protein HBE96_22210 [Clostridium sp. P21]|uniref:Uncharacterized protein n=1 Tax=Clostridium muellerianum TaxID=2716538 RepID=A0A7Y0EKU5_9CLOT|nr:hypothetical protein [Clostridium muellerianum]NMM65300.1 hypothetical protein [Clostridium muellerianum]